MATDDDEMVADADAMTDGEDGDPSVADRIKGVRDRLERRRKAKRAEKRAQSRSKQREREAREQRIEANEPETVGESVAAASKETKLLASELGITKARARQVIDRGSEALSELGDQFDTDGDGDTDILEAIEAQTGGQGTGQARTQGRDEFEPPVGDVEDDFDALEFEGIEEDLGIDEPIEEQQDRGLF